MLLFTQTHVHLYHSIQLFVLVHDSADQLCCQLNYHARSNVGSLTIKIKEMCYTLYYRSTSNLTNFNLSSSSSSKISAGNHRIIYLAEIIVIYLITMQMLNSMSLILHEQLS